jgi:hypothetical protein
MKLIRYTFLIVTIILFFQGIAVAGSSIGIILDGYQKDCKIEHEKKQSACKYGAQLYDGDRIIKENIHALVIQWSPFAKLNDTHVVVYEPPDNKKGILQKVKEFLNFTKSKHVSAYAVSRGGSILLPNDGATLIGGYPTRFSWTESGNHIVFRDNKEKEIYRTAVKNKQSIELLPENIGMKEDVVYDWFIDGSSSEVTYSYRLRLLSAKLSEQLITDLKLIDNEKISDNDKKLQKAAYLQLLSNAYPNNYDLYWLSYQIISDADETSMESDNKEVLQELKRNYKLHLAGDM